MFWERVRIIALLILSVFGCTGNILILIIVNRRFFRKTPSAALISGLCIADCSVLCLQSFQIVNKLRPHVSSYDCAIFFFMDVFRLLSVWIICLISLERCSFVFNPCHIPHIQSRLKSRIVVIILFIISLLIFSHYTKHMQIKYIYNLNRTMPVRSLCVYKKDFHRIAWECIRAALTYWLIIPICIVCNCIIIRRIYQATRIERTLNIKSRNRLELSSTQHQLTIMLVASSSCFVITATPSTIHTIYLSISHNLSIYQYVIHIITNILLHFHYASNFLVFVFSCARFRIELSELFRNLLFFRICKKWHPRSISNTEQMFFQSIKQQRTPIKLLKSKAYLHRRSNPNAMNLLAMNNYNHDIGRNYQHCLQNYYR